MQALNTAQAGDIIYVQGGTYSGVAISGVQIAGQVVIASADPSNPAVFTGLNVANSKGLTFQGLEFAVPASSNGAAFKVMGSQDVHFDRVNVHGSLDGDPTNDANGLQIGSSRNVSVTGSEFQQLKNGLDIGGNTGVVVQGNYFHDIRIDGIDSTGANQVVIDGNYFTNFRHLAGDHSDAIQFFTQNRNASVSDITITNNFIAQGTGAVMQGVFMSDEMGNLPYLNVKIAGNVILGGNWNGIFINHGENVEISNNYVAGVAGSSTLPRILWTNDVTGSVVNNVATSYSTGNAAYTAGNGTTPRIDDIGSDMARTWLQKHPEFFLKVPETVLDLIEGGHFSPAATVAPPVAQETAAVAVAVVAPTPGDVVTAGASSDQIALSKGNDTVSGGVGDDTIQGVSGSNYLRGDDGNDVIHGGTGFDDINGNVGNDSAYGGLGDDWVVGGKGDDIVAGEDGNDIVYGNLGSDTVDGGAGDDIVRGGQDNDWIDAGAGNDWISGDRGDDTLIGGAGADVFHTFADAGMDRVLDFNRAEGDRVMVDAGTQYSVAQTGDDVTISMVGGGHMVLVGVQLSSLSDGWIFTA